MLHHTPQWSAISCMTHRWPCCNFPALLQTLLGNLMGLSHTFHYFIWDCVILNTPEVHTLSLCLRHTLNTENNRTGGLYTISRYFCSVMSTKSNCPRKNHNKVGRLRTLGQVFHCEACCFLLLPSHAQLEACCVELLALMAVHTFVAGNRTAAL